MTVNSVASASSMASSLPVLLALLLIIASASAAAGPAQPPTLDDRLAGEGPQQCWEALMEISSCTGDIALFFLNGKAYLGPACCRAVRAIEQLCWGAKTMLSAVGFTPEEGDMLMGYCDPAGTKGLVRH